MLKMVAAGATVLFLATSPLAYAQTSSAGKSDQITAADWNNLTDLRIDLIKAALQLTPDQAKYWPAIESAIRTRAKDRQARIAKIAETVGSRADDSPIEFCKTAIPLSLCSAAPMPWLNARLI